MKNSRAKCWLRTSFFSKKQDYQLPVLLPVEPQETPVMTKVRQAITCIGIGVAIAWNTAILAHSENHENSSQEMAIEDVREKFIPLVLGVSGGSDHGTGFLYKDEMNREWIITAAHVTNGANDVRISFPAWNSRGSLIDKPNFYNINVNEHEHNVLYQLGYVQQARVVTEYPQADLAVIEIKDKPITSRDPEPFSHTQTNVIENEARVDIYIIGHQNNRDMWKITNGELVKEIDAKSFPVPNDRYVGTLLKVEISAHFGDSGAPMFDQEGTLYGLIIRGPRGGGDSLAYAVPVSRIDSLLEQVTRHYAFYIGNGTSHSVEYNVEWGTTLQNEEKFTELKPDGVKAHHHIQSNAQEDSEISIKYYDGQKQPITCSIRLDSQASQHFGPDIDTRIDSGQILQIYVFLITLDSKWHLV